MQIKYIAGTCYMYSYIVYQERGMTRVLLNLAKKLMRCGFCMARIWHQMTYAVVVDLKIVMNFSFFSNTSLSFLILYLNSLPSFPFLFFSSLFPQCSYSDFISRFFYLKK